MKIHVTDIEWDTTDEGGKPLPEKEVSKLKLPKVVDVELDDDGEDLGEQIADIISDDYGFCVNSFRYIPSDDKQTEDEALVAVFNACMAGAGIGAVSMGDGCVFVDVNGTTFRLNLEKCEDN